MAPSEVQDSSHGEGTIKTAKRPTSRSSRISKTRSSSSANDDSKSFEDLDETLPLPDEIQRKHDEDSQRQQRKGTSKSGRECDDEIAMDVDEGADAEFLRVPIVQNDSGRGDASNQNNDTREETPKPKLSEDNYSRNCRRLLCILKGERPRSNSTFAGNSNFTSDFTISGEDAASLLEYLTKLHKSEILFADLGGILSNENENDGLTGSCRHENMNHKNNNEFRSSEMETNLGWNLVKWAVKVAIFSLNSSIGTNHSNDRSNADQNGGKKMATFDPVTAKRILVDGILPFASLSSPAYPAINCLNNSNSPKTPTGPVSTAIAMPTSTITMMATKGNNIGVAQTQIKQAQIEKKIHMQSAYIFNLIRSIVTDELLPLALVPASTSSTTNNAPLNVRNEIGKENSLVESHGQINTMPLELLLSSFLTRMDSEEVSPNYRDYCHHEGEDECFMTVDAILDRLCCVPPSKSNFYFHYSTSNAKTNNKSKSSTMYQTNTATCDTNPWQLRPHSTAALMATLREIESILPGRLSRVRVWRKIPGIRHNHNHDDGDSATAESGTSNMQAEFQYHYLDRPTYICQAALFSLSRLSCKEGNDSVNIYDPDALPPLVYQLGLFPMGALRGCEPANVAGGGGGLKGVIKTAHVSGGENENEKQRGKRIRRLCLEGIAGVLDDAEFDVAHGCYNNNRGRSDNLGSDAFVIRRNDAISEPSTLNQQKRRNEELWRWTQYTCLSHMGSCMRSDPEMAKAVISMLIGECDSTVDSILSDAANEKDGSEIPPFRYQRINPFKLAMGLSMASSVPRVRSLALRALQDLIMEEETIRIRRGLDVDGNTLGMGQPWMNCFVKCLEFSSGCQTEVIDVDRNIGHGRKLSRMLRCLLSVAKFAESSEHGVGVGSGGGGGGSASYLLQSLLSLGFLLIDSVKKDDIIDSKSPAPQSFSVLAPTTDISSFDGDTSFRADTSAIHAAARIGRFLLCFLFYQSAAGSSHFLSRSLSSMTASSSTDGGTPLCRSILRSAVDKFCGMAPNALGHAQLLIDLLEFTPRSSINFFTTRGNSGGEELDDKQNEEVVPVALAAFHLQPLIECFANVPGGGLNPAVASNAIIPAVENLLLIQATSRPGLTGYLWKKRDLEDHIDHAFLLAKKALFCSDVEKRKFAATLLVALLRVTSVASSLHDIRATAIWYPVIDELRGCLRRCITQHQPSVRIEAYSSLVSVLPSSAMAVSGSTQSQDSISPHSTVSGVTTTPMRSSNERCRAHVSQAGHKAIIKIVSEVFFSQLERYVTTPQEDSRDREARRQRAINIGSQLSQMETDENRDDNISMPFRFEACISTRPINRMDIKPKGGKPKKSSPVGQTLLEEAMGRVNEPLSHLFASSSVASSLDPQGELKRYMDQIRNRMARCNDIDSYLKWVESCKQIVGINDDAKRTEEMAVTKLATLVVVANVADVLIGTTNFNDENDNPQVTNYESTSQIVERLFNLRSDAITRAVEIMSSFVHVKPKREAKAPKKTKDVVGTTDHAVSKAENGEISQAKLTKTSDVNPATASRNQKLIEEVLSLCPAPQLEFIAPAFRKFGALASASKKTNRKDSNDEDSLQSNISRLIHNMPFRRFIITKSLLLVSGASTVIRAGSRFCSMPSNPIAAYMSLGPLLLAEFCSLCYDMENTSIATKNSASQSTQYLSLTQLSLRAFSFCVHGLSTSTTNQAMTNAQRVQFMISNAIRIASRAAPSSKDGWDYYQSLNVQENNAPQDEIELKKSLTPFVSFKVDASAPDRLCLFSELMRSSMYGEAIECCQLIKAAANSFSEPSIKHHLGVMLLRCFEQIKQVGVGLLGLDHGESNQNESCACYAIDTAFKLNNHLDGDTFVPFPHGFLGLDLMSKNGLRLARSKLGLTSMCPNYWPERHLDRIMDEFSSQLGCPGTIQQITWALTVQLGCSSIFSEVLNSSSAVTKRNSGLACIKSASKTPESNFAKETRSIADMISASIESGLNSAEFVTAKLIPHMSGSTLNMAQRLVMCLLMSASKVIHASSPSAEFVDTSGSFASLLLKSTKKLYSILARLVLSFLANPHSFESSETKCLLKYLATNLMQSVAALLYTLQEKHETTDGKFLTENKIETHGKISALLVCEKEKLDNAFLKIGAKLKHVGVSSDWLQEYSFISLNRDFVIKRADIQLAKEREAPRTKKNFVSGHKRKIKCETFGKMTKQIKKDKTEVPVAKIVEGDEEVDDVSHDSGGGEEFESDDDDVVSLGNLTNDMGDDDLLEGEDLDGDSFIADSNEHNSSEFDSEHD